MALVIRMVYPVPANPDPVVTVQSPPTLIVPEPEIVLAPDPEELNEPVVKVWPPSARVGVDEVPNVVVPDTVNAPANVVVPVWSIVIAGMVLELPVMVPVPTMVTVKLVNVPLEDNVNPLRFRDVAAMVKAVVPKSNLLNQLLVVNLAIAVPDPVSVKFGALELEPPVVPNTNILITSAAAVNPPVPVTENPVAFAMSRLVELPVVVANTILPVPNAILRVLLRLELNVPVVNVYPARSNVPLFKVVATVAVVNVTAPASVVVPPGQLTVISTIGLPLGVNVPVPPKIAVNPVNVPPELNVKLPKVNDVVPGLKAVVPKSTLLKKPVLVIVCTAVPDPVNVKLTPLEIVPLEEAQLNVRVISAAAVKPPVPVNEKPMAIPILRLVAPAVVVANTMLPVPNAILRVLELVELNVPVVNVYPARSSVPAVNVVTAVAVVNVTAPASVVVPVLLMVSVTIGRPLGVNVPVPAVVIVNPVYAPPELNVRLLTVNDVVPGSNAVVPKSILLKNPVLVIVCTAVPDPVNVKLTPLAIAPAVVAQLNDLVMSAAAVNPPVPVAVKLVAVRISRLSVAVVVVANTMLPVPKAIERTPVPVLLNTPVVNVNPPRSNVPAVSV